MSFKRVDDLSAGKPSPPAQKESPHREPSFECQRPKNDTSTSINQGNAPPSAQPAEAAIARPPNTEHTNLTSDRFGRHPLPTYDPSWPNPVVGTATRTYWREPFHTRCDAWDGVSAPPDEGAFSSRPETDFDVMRRPA